MDPKFAVYFALCVMSIFTLLAFCYIASRTTSFMQKSSIRIYCSLWYRLPLIKQKDLLFLLQFTHRDRFVESFGMVQCSLETFAKVKTIPNMFALNAFVL